MSNVIKEWKCMAHGYFEGIEAVCPKGCTAVQQVFLTPVGIKGDKTKFADATFRQLAQDFGLSNMQGKPGEPARILSGAQKAEMQAQQDFRARFGAMPTGKNAVQQVLQQHKAPETNALSQIKDQLPAMKRQVIATRDPDKESVAKVRAA